MAAIPEELNISKGTKHQAMVKVKGTGLSMPFSIITGHKDGPTVFVTTGIHGSEYPGTLAMIELLQEFTPDIVQGRLMAIHPVNTMAFEARLSMIFPEDGHNLNRVFPGKPDGLASERVAWHITELQDMADFYLDLHSGDLYEELTPYVYFPGKGDETVIEASRKAAACLNLPFMVRSSSTTGAYNSAALRGTPSLLIERGGAGNCLREEVDFYKKDLINIFRHLNLLPGEPDKPGQPPAELENVIYLEAEQAAVWRCFIRAGDKVTTGQLLGELLDPFGRVLKTFAAERDGIVLYRLGTLSSNFGDVLVAY